MSNESTTDEMTSDLSPGAALADPRNTIVLADEMLDGERDPFRRAHTLWIRGLACREVRDLTGAARDLHACLEELERTPSITGELVTELRDDALIAQALVRFLQGDTDAALAALDDVLADVPVNRAARAEIQSALVLQRAGRLREAAVVGERALDHAERQGDPTLITAVRTNVGLLYGQQGRFARAVALLGAAIVVADEHDLAVAAVIARHNRGYVMGRAGRWRDALTELDDAAERYHGLHDAAGVALTGADHAAILFELGLVDDAASEVDEALVVIRAEGVPADVADVAILAARIRLACGDLGGGRSAAAEARDLFESQGRTAMLPLAEQLVITADHRRGDAPPDALEAVAVRLAEFDWYPESAAAIVAAARGHAERGDAARAEALIAEVDPRRGGAIVRLERSVVSAVAAEAAGRSGAARRAVTVGLRTLAENLASFDALELQAHATERGSELMEIGVRLAWRDRRPGELVRRLEMVRSLPFERTGVVVPNSPVVVMMQELRAVSYRRRLALGAGSSTAQLAREQAELEQRIRYASLTTRERPIEATVRGPSVLDGTVAVEYFEHDGDLAAATSSGKRWHLHELGPANVAQAEIDHLVFALDSVHRAGSSERRGRAAAMMRAAGERVERALIPDVVRNEGVPVAADRRLAIVPTPALHGVPWGALPSIAARPFVVTPSLATLHTPDPASDSVSGDEHGVVVIVGPDLPEADREATGVIGAHRIARGPIRTVDEAIEQLGRASVAHFACHGRLRHDNPAFSSLVLDDGELTMFDLQGVGRLPATIVLSACDVGQGLVTTGGAVLGLATALVQLGVQSVIAPVTAVDDAWSADFAVHLHRHLAEGSTAPQALAATRREDERLQIAGASFLCFGS